MLVCAPLSICEFTITGDKNAPLAFTNCALNEPGTLGLELKTVMQEDSEFSRLLV